MGTRSHTLVIGGFPTEEPETYVGIYRQYDGYPQGHGLDIAKFLSGMTVTNGIRTDTTQRIANGPGCLAAQIVAHLKESPGGIYLEPPQWLGQEEFIYEIEAIFPNDFDVSGRIFLTAWEGSKENDPFFTGTPDDFIKQFDTSLGAT